MNHMTRQQRVQRAYVAILGGATAVGALGAVFAAMLAGSSAAATLVAPNNTSEPELTGTARVGHVLRTSNGSWSGTEPISSAYRWFRCDGAGAPDASNCRRIANAAKRDLRPAQFGCA